MKKIICILFAFAFLFIPLSAAANEIDALHRIERNGTAYVPMRYAALAFGWEVEWVREGRDMIFTCPAGRVMVFALHEMLEAEIGFMAEGRFWVPMNYALRLFSPNPPRVVPDSRGVYWLTLTEEARDIVLADFDYLVDFIMLNTPWDSVVQRSLSHGMRLGRVSLMVRDIIVNRRPIDITVEGDYFWDWFIMHPGDDAHTLAANYLYALLVYYYAPMFSGVGHLGVRTLGRYTTQLISFSQWYDNLMGYNTYDYWLSGILDVFNHPRARWFYGEVEITVDENPMPVIYDNVETESLVPGEIALLRINSFFSNTNYDDEIILPFLQQVSDYDNLIIDLRGNGGGLGGYFTQLVFRRLINAPVEVGSFQFFSGGPVAVAAMNADLQTALRRMDEDEYSGILYAYITNADAFICERGFTYFNADDLRRLSYVMVSRSVITPTEDAVGFGGDIWLLVDGGSASASAMAVELAQYTGFATVVGENTSHVMGSAHTYIVLPRTGIVWRTDIGYKTDNYGRSLEVYGLAPDIRNFPRMDALETVLSIINP